MSYRDVVGLAKETTWNTAVTTPTYYPPVKAEGISLDRNLIETEETTGLPFTLGAEYGTEKYAGTIEGNIRSASFGLFLSALLGDATSTQPDAGGNPTVYQHVYDPASNDPNSVSIMTVNRDPSTTVVEVYGGAKIDSMECNFDVDDYATMSASFIAASVDTDESDPTETLDTSQRFAFSTVKVYLDAAAGSYTEIDVSSAGITYANNLRDDEFILGSTTLNALDPQNRTAEVRFTPTENISTHYRRAQESSPTACKLKIEATGALISGTYYHKITWEFDLVEYMKAPLDIDAGSAVKDIEVTARCAYNTSTSSFCTVTLVNTEDGSDY